MSLADRLVLIPTFQRSDLLFCALEAIRAADPSAEIHVFPDKGTSEKEVCQKFNAIEHLVLAHQTHGNSYNMLEALKWASTKGHPRVYIIEDDAIIDPTFFSWADAALDRQEDDIFAACGWRPSPDMKEGKETEPDYRMSWYLSVCAALPISSVRSIVQHARTEYYNDLAGYCDRMFPQSCYRGTGHYEQDGLILRICNQQSKRCVWPRKPRATHAGFTGYHMPGKRLSGSLEERVQIIKLALKNPSLLNLLMSGGAPPDLSPCSICQTPLLSTDKRAVVTCSACFHRMSDRPKVSDTVYYTKPTELPLPNAPIEHRRHPEQP
jgi:hypothetical protein